MAALGGAAGSGLLASDAAAQVKRRDDEDSPPPLLIAQASANGPILLAGHRSHRSHSSHRSHYSSRGGGGYRGSYSGSWGSSTSTYTPPVVREKPPLPPKPARVSFVAFPGGKILIDGKPIGRDATGTLVLKPGTYVIRVENRFLGHHSESVDIDEGQTGAIEINW
ncbi:MAG: hypothetical protein ACTHU0_24215 [Kofleriaceae bacterium]